MVTICGNQAPGAFVWGVAKNVQSVKSAAFSKASIGPYPGADLEYTRDRPHGVCAHLAVRHLLQGLDRRAAGAESTDRAA